MHRRLSVRTFQNQSKPFQTFRNLVKIRFITHEFQSKSLFFGRNRNNRRRQLSGSSMISNFGGRDLGSNNNSTSTNSNAGSESPLPSPRFSRYIRPHQPSERGNSQGRDSSDNNSGVSHHNDSSSSRPTSATSSSTYSPRLGKICSQPPSVNLGKNLLGYRGKNLLFIQKFPGL